MSETSFDTAQHQPWVPADTLRQTYNLELFDALLPELRSIVIVEELEVTQEGVRIPQVVARHSGMGLNRIEPKHINRVTKQLAKQGLPQAALAPGLIDLRHEELEEEALVRILLPRAFGVTANVVAFDKSPYNLQKFHSSCHDMIKILSSPPRPFFKYHQVRVGGRPLLNGIGYLANTRYGLVPAEISEVKQQLGQAAFMGVIDVPDSVKRVVNVKPSSQKTGDQTSTGNTQTLAQMEPVDSSDEEVIGHDSSSLPNPAEQTEPILSLSPWMQGFLTEFRFKEDNLPQDDTEAIEILASGSIDMLAACSQETRELISRLGITAYLELLEQDASDQSGSMNLASALTFVSREQDGVTNRIIKLARVLALKIRDEDKANEHCSKLELNWQNLPRAFLIIRAAITKQAPDAVIESPKTKMFGDVVETFLNPPKRTKQNSK